MARNVVGVVAESQTGDNPLETLRARLYDETRDLRAWLDVIRQGAVCRASGAGEVAESYLAELIETWPESFRKPPCPCGNWSRWMSRVPETKPERQAWLWSLSVELRTGVERPRCFGCPVRGWVEANGQVLPLRCDQQLVATDKTLKVLPHYTEAAGALQVCWDADTKCFTASKAGEETRHLRSGDTLHVGALQTTFGTEPTEVLGVQEPQSAVRFVRLHSSMTVGRDPSCDVVLTSPYIDRRHCLIHKHRNSTIIEDLHSTNGTWFYGHQLRTPARLRARTSAGGFPDSARIRSTILSLERWPHTPPSPSHSPFLCFDDIGVFLLLQDSEQMLRAIPFRGTSMVMGSAPGCDVLLEGEQIAPQHCRIAFDESEGRFFVEELGSVSGTILLGQRVSALVPGQPKAISPARTRGQSPTKIRLGRYRAWINYWPYLFDPFLSSDTTP